MRTGGIKSGEPIVFIGGNKSVQPYSFGQWCYEHSDSLQGLTWDQVVQKYKQHRATMSTTPILDSQEDLL